MQFDKKGPGLEDLLSGIGFAWQDIGSRQAVMEASREKPPCLIERMPAGSRRDSLWAKAKPASHGGSASVIM